MREDINEMADQIIKTINEHPENGSQGEVLAALLNAIGSVLASVQCRDCRKIKARGTKKGLAEIIEFALKAPGHSNHVH